MRDGLMRRSVTRPVDHSWDLDVPGARAVQLDLRERRVDRPPPGFAPRLVAGADMSIRRGRDTGYAAIVVYDVEAGRIVDRATVTGPVEFPYVPGLLSFRELPLILQAWSRLELRPDVVLFDGHGYAHPRRFGLACHGGLLLDLPSIGCAKSILVGEHDPLGEERGATAPLRHEGETVGVAVRTRSGVRPVYVSVGHRMELGAAVDIVLSVAPRYRVPEPTRAADKLVGRLRREAEA